MHKQKNKQMTKTIQKPVEKTLLTCEICKKENCKGEKGLSAHIRIMHPQLNKIKTKTSKFTRNFFKHFLNFNPKKSKTYN